MEQVYKRKDFIVKLFACLFIVVFLLFTFIGSRVFASSNEFEIVNPLNDDVASFELPEWVFTENYNYFINYKTQTEVDVGYTTVSIVLFKDDYNFILNKNSDGSLSGSGYYKQLYSHYADFPSQKQNLLTVKNLSEPSRKFENFSISSNFVGNFFASTDIYNSNGDVVFQAPPQEQDKVLAPIVEGQEMKPLQEILQILPIVMIVIVGYLALRKGLATLFRFLRTS